MYRISRRNVLAIRWFLISTIVTFLLAYPMGVIATKIAISSRAISIPGDSKECNWDNCTCFILPTSEDILSDAGLNDTSRRSIPCFVFGIMVGGVVFILGSCSILIGSAVYVIWKSKCVPLVLGFYSNDDVTKD
jgi:hypothetical protein